MSDLVSFELAQKLKEKGYPQHWSDNDYIVENEYEDNFEIGAYYDRCLIPEHIVTIAAPTISQVLKWLREEKGIHVCIALGEFSDWMYDVSRIDGNMFCEAEDGFQSYEQATLAGVNYCLENLI